MYDFKTDYLVLDNQFMWLFPREDCISCSQHFVAYFVLCPGLETPESPLFPVNMLS